MRSAFFSPGIRPHLSTAMPAASHERCTTQQHKVSLKVSCGRPFGELDALLWMCPAQDLDPAHFPHEQLKLTPSLDTIIHFVASLTSTLYNNHHIIFLYKFIPFWGSITSIFTVFCATYVIGKTMDFYFVNKKRSDSFFSYLQRTEYDQMVKAAAKYLELEPTYLQFFKTQSYREAPGHALR